MDEGSAPVLRGAAFWREKAAQFARMARMFNADEQLSACFAALAADARVRARKAVAARPARRNRSAGQGAPVTP